MKTSRYMPMTSQTRGVATALLLAGLLGNVCIADHDHRYSGRYSGELSQGQQTRARVGNTIIRSDQAAYQRQQQAAFHRQQVRPAPQIDYQTELLRAMSAQDWRAVVVICQQAAKAQRDGQLRGKWLHFLAVAQSRQGYWAASEYTLRDALRWRPADYGIQESLAVTLLKQRRFDTALDFLRGLGVQPQNSNRHMALMAYSALQAGNYPVAAGAYAELMSSMPNDGRWLLGFAQAVEAQGKLVVAGYSYKRVARDTNMSPLLRRFALNRLAALSTS